MGGRAFENLSRIKRADIPLTLDFLAPILQIEPVYLATNMMGSCGKQADSGDIDIALDMNKFSKTDFFDITKRAQAHFGVGAVSVSGKSVFDFSALIANAQFNMSVPIPHTNDYVQVDFIYGNAEWLKFSHWSAGDASDWKGVFMSQTYGVLAKMKVLYRYPEDAVLDKDNNIDERLGEVAYRYNLEHGLRVQCRLRLREGFVPVSADDFETGCEGPMPPRVPRVGFINDPLAVVRMLVGPSATLESTNTFEKLLVSLRADRNEEEWEVLTDRLAYSLARSGARYYYEPEEFAAMMKGLI